MSQQKVIELVTMAHNGNVTLNETIITVKREYILVALEANRFNISKTAVAVGMHRNTLRRICEILKIEVAALKVVKKPVASSTIRQHSTRLA